MRVQASRDQPGSVSRAREEDGRAELGPARRQVNTFFDTSDRALDRLKYTLRLREEDDRFLLTAKGPTSAPRGQSVRARDEAEVTLDAAIAREILQGTRMPFEVLREQIGSTAFLDEMEALIAGRPQQRLGSFENLRTVLGPVTLNLSDEPIELELELDESQFPGGHVHYEVEVEVTPDQSRLAERTLRALWQELNFPWVDDTPSKFKRFRDASLGLSID